jgi:hypothetical protein
MRLSQKRRILAMINEILRIGDKEGIPVSVMAEIYALQVFVAEILPESGEE